ncbi:MAG: sodium:solute symporter family protein [Candidatus Aerophobetes bacterium]|nr:sodium:solute symporter family protein [Candidatus Aerophobetes bacterium]
MESWIIVLICMIAYLAFALTLGLLAGYKRKASISEYVVAERNISLVVMWFLMGGTIFSAFAFLGGPGWAYSKGAASFYILSYCALGMLPWYFFGPKVSRIGEKFSHVTEGDLLKGRYKSNLLPVLIALVATIAFIQYICLQLKGVAYTVNILTGGHIPFWAGALIAYGVVVIYVITSGVRGAAWSDVVQGGLMLIIAWVVGLYLVYHLYGGPTAMFQQIAATNPGHLIIGKEGSHMGIVAFSTATLVSIIGFMMWPHLFMKTYTTNIKTMKRTVMMYPLFAIFLVPVLFIGFSGMMQVSSGELAAADQILPTMVHMLKFSPLLIGIIGAGTLAASMSSADAITHGAASTFVEDVVRVINPKMSEKSVLWTLRIMVLVIGAISYYLAIFGSASLVALLLGGYGFIVQIAPPVYGAVYWKRATKGGAISGFVVGALLNSYFAYSGAASPAGINPGIVGLIGNIIVFVVVSLLTKPQDMEHVNKFVEA